MSQSPPTESNTGIQPLDYRQAHSLSEVWAIAAQRFHEIVAVKAPHQQPPVELTYGQLYRQMQQFAAGLQALGLRGNLDSEPPRVALIADNSPRWLVADQGILLAGGADAVRSPQADRGELLYILEHSGSIALVAEDWSTVQKLQPELERLPLQFILLLSEETPPQGPMKALNFGQILELGKTHFNAFQPVQRDRQSLATLMYTSGTSGQPKGVMLTHGNLLSQIAGALKVVQPQPAEPIMSILPVWHCYERTFEYFIFSQGCTQIYTNIRQVKPDLQEFKPHYMVAVPRLWESIYEGVQKQFREQPESRQRLIRFFFKVSQRYIEARRIVYNLSLDHLNPSPLAKLTAGLQMLALWPLHQLGDRIVYHKVRAATGGQFKYIVSGGGSLADHLEDFFEIVGIEILEGYGLTETAPITNVRRPWYNLRGSAGKPLPDTEIRIVDPETRQPLPPGHQGLILIRGPQVMQGYYKNPEATAKAIDPQGWFDSGDLGWQTAQGDLMITGRAKDTIVLTNGENIEPQPIEDACIRSPYIDQIMLVGQDQRSLGALIVPNLEALQQWATSHNYALLAGQAEVPAPSAAAAPTQTIDLNSKPVQDLYRQELNREVRNRPGYRPDDRIGPFQLILEPFSIDNGRMTQTLKVRRNVVMEHYRDMINGMFV
jgi:long-chain acyl-CoA synthetase